MYGCLVGIDFFSFAPMQIRPAASAFHGFFDGPACEIVLLRPSLLYVSDGFRCQILPVHLF